MKTQVKGSAKVKMSHDKAMEAFEAARKTTCDAIDGAMAFGYQGVNEPPSKDHWLWTYWDHGRNMAIAEKKLPDILFDGYRVWQEVSEINKHIKGETIAIVLDAVVKLAKQDLAK